MWKSHCGKFVLLLALSDSIRAQSTLQLTAPPPAAVVNASATVTGAQGPASYFYWVVATYPIGNANPRGPITVANGPNTLTSANAIRISWTAPGGQSSFDLLKTAGPTLPSSCTCLLASATTATSFTDTGQALSAYTLSVAPGVTGTEALNNRDFSTARFTFDRSLQLQVGGLFFPDGTQLATATASACATCVTSAAALTLNQLLIGSGGQGSQALGSLGTTTTLLHGNAAGAPTFVAVATADAGANVRGNGTLFQLAAGAAPAANDCAKFDASGNIVTNGAACAAAATPGGADTNVQFNNAGAFGGSANFTFATASGLVTMKYAAANVTINNPVLTLDNLLAGSYTVLDFRRNAVQQAYISASPSDQILYINAAGSINEIRVGSNNTVNAAVRLGPTSGAQIMDTTTTWSVRGNTINCDVANVSCGVNTAPGATASMYVKNAGNRPAFRGEGTGGQTAVLLDLLTSTPTSVYDVAINGLVGMVGLTASKGTKFTLTGCAAGTTVGGATAGTFVSGTTGTCTVVITMNGATGLTAPNGWHCSASDRTTPSNLYDQSASTTTTATLTGTTTTGDVISFSCMGF